MGVTSLINSGEFGKVYSIFRIVVSCYIIVNTSNFENGLRCSLPGNHDILFLSLPSECEIIP
jgi:hypothetical protein